MSDTKPTQDMHGSPEFYRLLGLAAELHNKKSHDYATNDNPFGNYTFAGQMALMFKHSALDAGFFGRMSEKIYRLANLESSGKTAKNESVSDTELDLVVIVCLWMAARRDRRINIPLKKAMDEIWKAEDKAYQDLAKPKCSLDHDKLRKELMSKFMQGNCPECGMILVKFTND